jgi:hypothetical protein
MSVLDNRSRPERVPTQKVLYETRVLQADPRSTPKNKERQIKKTVTTSKINKKLFII